MTNTTTSMSNGKVPGIKVDNNGITTLIAGVLQEQVKHIKAVQLQTTYKIPITRNTSANAVDNGESSGQKSKQEQGENGIEGPQIIPSVHTQEQGNSSRPQNTSYISNGNNVSSQETSMGILPYGVYTGEKVGNKTNENKTLFTIASQKVKPLKGIGAAYWNFSVSQPLEPNPEINSSKVDQQSVQPNGASYWGTQPITKPQQTNTQQQQQQQPSTSQQQQQQEQQSITYPSQIQQQQPVLQQYSQPNPYAYQQPSTYQQPQQQTQQQQATQQYSQSNPYAYQQPSTYQQPQQQQTQRPSTYQQQQQQQTSQQPITYQQQKQVSAISNEVKTTQTLAPVYSTSSATGTKQEQQSAIISSSAKTEAVTSPIPYGTKVPNEVVASKEQSTSPPNSSYVFQTNPPPLTNPAVTNTAANQVGSQSAENQNKTPAVEYYNRKEPVPNGTEATYYSTATQGPPQSGAVQKVDESQLSPHIYTPKVTNYQWPPEATPLENPPAQQNGTLQQVVSSEKEVSSLTICKLWFYFVFSFILHANSPSSHAV